ncbi:V-type proton ATPase subunit a1 [Salvia divinorum]|uniref:V-type proton ATPase subunit a n=1 Tax=Salvia divinorum TaxID=28513 RepID=A0ABD1GKD6_SALDI
MEYIDRLPSMDLMRSEKMMLAQLIIPVESAHRAVSYLGQLGLLQFTDLNDDKSPFQRTFVNQVKRCAEMSRKLRFFKDQIHKAGLILSPHPASETDIELEELEAGLAEHEHELIEMNHNSEKLQTTMSCLSSRWSYRRQVTSLCLIGIVLLHKIQNSESTLEQEMQPGMSDQFGVKFVSGVICKSKALRFERMLFRTTRGNMLFNQAPADDPIVDPASNDMVENIVFMVFFSGEQARKKIHKICEAFGANCYPVPEDSIKRRQITRDVLSRLSELETTLDAGLRH